MAYSAYLQIEARLINCGSRELPSMGEELQMRHFVAPVNGALDTRFIV